MASPIDLPPPDAPTFGLPLPPGAWADVDGPVFYRAWDGPSDGPVFVLVHGLAGSHINWWRVAPMLARRGRVIALDLPGFGLTPRLGRSSALRESRIVLGRFLQSTCGETPALLAGNSMGGSLGILQAAIEPASVAGLILSSPAIPWGPGVRQSAIARLGFGLYRVPGLGHAFALARMKGASPERIADLGFALLYGDRARIDPATRASQVEMAMLAQSDPDAVPAFLQAARSILRLQGFPRTTREVIERVRCPVLLLHGTRDVLVPYGAATQAAEANPTWRFVTFEGVGHAIQMEDPDGWIHAVNVWLDADIQRT